jgi:ABC-type polar amino acid transport system ATPase subunit
MMASPLLRVRGLSKVFADVPVLDRVDLDVARGEVVMVIGPSGAGKSTLLRCINRIETPTDGEVVLDGITWRGHSAVNGWCRTRRPKQRASDNGLAWYFSASICSRI